MKRITILEETTKNPITLIGKRAGICCDADVSDDEKNYRRGLQCIKSEHGRTFEFVNVEMIIEGYSARVIREFERHVVGASYLQSSTRYVDYTKDGLSYIIPKTIAHNMSATSTYVETINTIKEACQYLEGICDVPKEDIANLFPLGMTTKVVDKRNLRSLINMAHQRKCKKAYWEFRELFADIEKSLSEYSDEWKWIVDNLFIPKCEYLGKCTENNGCGRGTNKKDKNGGDVDAK